MKFTVFLSILSRFQKLGKASLIALLWANFAAAGDRIGNGGDVVFCSVDGVETARFFDAYEAEEEYGLIPDFGSNSGVLEKVRFALEALKEVSPKRAARYWEQAQTFLEESRFVNGRLEDIDDSNHAVLPEGCEIRQIVIQKIPRDISEKRYLIQRRLWEMLSEDDKATLILHEVVYREAISYGQNDSRHVRFFVANIISQEVKKMDAKRFHDLLVAIGFNDFEYEGKVFRIFAERGTCGRETIVDYRKPLAAFYDSGRLWFALLACDETTQAWDQEFQLGRYMESRQITYFAEGTPVAFRSASKGQVMVRGENLTIAEGGVRIHTNGNLEFASIQFPATFYTRDSKKWHCHANFSATMFFDEEGYLTSTPSATYCR